jgi:putative transposase
MARLSRVVVPGVPHHVTQRGNRRMAIFSEPSDYELYRDLVAERLTRHGVVCWAYCLMPNHVHFILAPPEGDASTAAAAISRSVGEAHRRYTAFVNARARVTGHLFQGRFGCVAMDDAHVLTALRYLAFNPVRARLSQSPEAWPWSSARAHLEGGGDALAAAAPVLERAPRFRDLLEMSVAERAALDGFETRSANGRPLGDDAFIASLERRLGRDLARRRPGRKRGDKVAASN